MSSAPCSVDGCPNPARKAGFCWGHYRRKRAGLPVHVELREPQGAPRDRAGIPRRSRVEQVVDAAVDLADANTSGDESEYRRAKHRLLVAADRKTPRQGTPEGPPRPRGRPRGGCSRMTLWRRRRGR